MKAVAIAPRGRCCEKNAQPALFSSRAAFEPPEEGSKKTSVVAAAQGGGFVYGPEHHTSG